MIYNICYGIGGTALLSLIFYFFCYIKCTKKDGSASQKFLISQKILSVYIFLAPGIISSIFLTFYFPDSRHIFLATVISYLFGMTGFILSIFQDKIFCRYAGRIFFIAVGFVWTSIYYTTFYLYHVPLWITVIFLILFAAILISVEVILKIKSLSANLWIIISLTLVSWLNYCGFITFCFRQNLSSALLFSGSMTFLATITYAVLEYGKGSFKNSAPIKLLAITVSQALIAAAGVLIFAAD